MSRNAMILGGLAVGLGVWLLFRGKKKQTQDEFRAKYPFVAAPSDFTLSREDFRAKYPLVSAPETQEEYEKRRAAFMGSEGEALFQARDAVGATEPPLTQDQEWWMQGNTQAGPLMEDGQFNPADGGSLNKLSDEERAAFSGPGGLTNVYGIVGGTGL